MRKRYWGYLLIAIYFALHFDIFWFERVDPIIFGMPYIMWSKIAYGILAVPFLYFVYKLMWPKLPEDDEAYK